LKDVRICFSKNGQLRGCGSNEDQGTLCQTERMMVPPVRSTARSDVLNALPPAVTQSFKPAPVPRPKLIEGPHGE
jgi:ribonuclease T2